MMQNASASDLALARAKDLVLSRPQDFTQAGRNLDSDFSVESICAKRRRVLSGFPVDLERDLSRQSTPWSRFGVALHDTAELAPLGLDAAEARRVVLLAWLAFDAEAGELAPTLTEFQHLPWRVADDDRFWEWRQFQAENWGKNAGFLRLVEVALEKLDRGALKPGRTTTGARARGSEPKPRRGERARMAIELFNAGAVYTIEEAAKAVGCSPQALHDNKNVKKAKDALLERYAREGAENIRAATFSGTLGRAADGISEDPEIDEG